MQELAKKLAAMARFRHVLAHVYTKLDLDLVYKHITSQPRGYQIVLEDYSQKTPRKKIDISEI
ncbi:MAG: HepT-like ribonuclease domain-containing protein [Candidatus Lokiarchaeia archaeon]